MKLNGFSLVVAAAFLAACGSSGSSDGNGNGNGSGSGSSSGGTSSGSSSGATGDNGGGDNDGGVADAGQADTAPPVDHGTPSTTYPAFKPDVAQLQNNNGKILASPKIVTITWGSDPNAAHYESFADALGDSAYWQDEVGEYGIGKATSDATMHIHMSAAPPAQISDTDIDSLVQANVTQKTVGTFAPDPTKWPTYDDNTLYVMYIPQATKLMLGGQEACSSGVGGYHDETQAGSYVYAVVPQCQFSATTTIPDESTESASHEIAEASLDPHPQTATGWVGLDQDHLGWDLFQQFQDENGDMCEFYRDSFGTITEGSTFSFDVQKMWSNKSIAAGHSPCVPYTDTYFSTTLISPEKITVDLSAFQGPASAPSTGIHAIVGQTVSFMVGFYSDGPMDAWQIQAVDGNPITASSTSTKHFSNIAIDKTSGQNGEKAQVTLTVTTAGRLKGELLTIVSSKDGKLCDKTNPTGVCHYMPILIGSM